MKSKRRKTNGTIEKRIRKVFPLIKVIKQTLQRQGLGQDKYRKEKQKGEDYKVLYKSLVLLRRQPPVLCYG